MTNAIPVPDFYDFLVGTKYQSGACHLSSTINPVDILHSLNHRKSVTEIFEGEIPGSVNIAQMCMSRRSSNSIGETICT